MGHPFTDEAVTNCHPLILDTVEPPRAMLVDRLPVKVRSDRQPGY
jgi:hypothetical protein